MAKASPGPGWETIQEPQTSSAASSEDEIEDEETSREEVPQTLKRKSGPPPIAQKRLKVTPPDERTMSLPNPLTAQLVEKFPVTLTSRAGPLMHQNSTATRPDPPSRSTSKLRPPGTSPAPIPVGLGKGKQKAIDNLGFNTSSSNLPSDRRGSPIGLANKRGISTLKPPLPTLADTLSSSSTPIQPTVSKLKTNIRTSVEIIDLTCSSDEAPQKQSPSINSTIRRPTRVYARKSTRRSASLYRPTLSTIVVPDSDEEPPVTTRTPKASSTSSTQSPGPVQSPANAPSPLLSIISSDVSSLVSSSSKPPLPRRKPSSQVSGSGAPAMQVAKTLSTMFRPSSKFPASGASKTASRPPLPKRLSGMDMSGLKEVLESTTIRASEPAAESEHPPSTSPCSKVAKGVPASSSSTPQVAQKPNFSSQHDQSSAKAATQLYTPLASRTTEIQGGFSGHDAIDLTLDDSDDDMTTASTSKTVGDATASSTSLKSLVGSTGSVKSAEVFPVVEAPTPSMSPALPKRHPRKLQLVKGEPVSPLRGASTRASRGENSARSTGSIVEKPTAYASRSVADVISERKATPTLPVQALLPLLSPSPPPRPQIENFPSKQLDSQLLQLAPNENEMVLSNFPSSEETSPHASSRSSPEIEIPHRRARKSTGGIAPTMSQKRRSSGTPNLPDSAATSASPIFKRAEPQRLLTSFELGSPVPSSTTPPSLPVILRKVEQSTIMYATSVTMVNEVEAGNLGWVPNDASAIQPDESNFDDILEYIDDPVQHVNETDSDLEVVESLLVSSSHSPMPEASGEEAVVDSTSLPSSPRAIAPSDDEDLLPRRQTRSSRSNSDEPANFFPDDEFVETPIESLPPSPSPDSLVPRPIKTFGGFPSLSWKTYRQDLRNFTLKCYYAKDLPHSLQDNINQWEESLRLQPTLAVVFQSTIQENTADDEPDAPMIEIINDVDDEPTPPWEFHYTNKMWHGEGVPPPDINGLKACNCTGKCDPKSKTCLCVQRQQQYTGDVTPDFAYDTRGRLKTLDYPIFECNDLCGCDEDCRNRVVQFGRKMAVSIQKTIDKGWGVFAGSKKIYGGSFIGIYSGELLTDAVGEQRGFKYNKFGRTYLFDLDFHHLRQGDEHWSIKYTVDAYHAGNFTRFLNHSCDPNCRLVPCYINESNIDKPLLAVFAQRDIDPFEEICFSYYGDPDDEDTQEQRTSPEMPDGQQKQDAAVYAPCACKAKNCRGTMFK